MANVRRLSAEEVMRVAQARFIQLYSLNYAGHSMPNHGFNSSPCGLSCEETKDVELACLLLASAEMVAKRQFDEGSRLLNLCDFFSSRTGSSVQRTVHYFSKALRERIGVEGFTASNGSETREEHIYPHEELVYEDPYLIACSIHLPFCQVTEVAGVQAIVECVASAKKVHYIDLAIRNGVYCIGLMQALAARKEFPIRLLKVTAIGTTCGDKIEETGKRLAQFAETLNLPFSFKTVMVREFKDIHKDMFEPKADEVIAVNSRFILNNMIMKPTCLEALIKMLRDLNPCIMVITDVDADHNSTTLLGRFHEALLFYTAFFESLEVCMDQYDLIRTTLEASYLGREIRNIVAAEGEERIFRRLTFDAWRKFLGRFGMMEQELSMASFYQAELLVNSYACKSSCTINRNGKCLTVGWKGRPIFSVSSWKFNQEKAQEKDVCTPNLLSNNHYDLL